MRHLIKSKAYDINLVVCITRGLKKTERSAHYDELRPQFERVTRMQSSGNCNSNFMELVKFVCRNLLLLFELE